MDAISRYHTLRELSIREVELNRDAERRRIVDERRAAGPVAIARRTPLRRRAVAALAHASRVAIPRPRRSA
jgi:hypothetical protein